MNHKENTENMIKDLRRIVLNNINKKNYLLFDADNTLFPNDSGKLFSKYSNFDFLKIKKIFESYGDYCFEAFYDVAKLYSEIPLDTFEEASKKTSENIIINQKFLDLIKEFENKIVIIIVTAGFKNIWKNVIDKNCFKIELIAGNNIRCDNYIVDNNLKGEVVTFLKENNKHVISFGDSFVDKEMLLYSDRSYLVIYEKIRKNLIDLLFKNGNSKLILMNNINIDSIKLDICNFEQIHNYIRSIL
jgi:phosphoserine phosphatase